MSKQPLQLVVFDWAGTTIDFGSRAPMLSFTGVFAAHGVEVTPAEASAPMGLNKREHLIAMLSNPVVAARWQAQHGRSWSEQDVDTMYHEFMPLQMQNIQRNSTLVPGLLELIANLQERGLKIGATTGYFREATNMVAELAKTAGYAPEANLCADDVPQGRPAPWMIFRVMEQLGVYPPSAVVNVGDTVPDIKSGLAAGCWSIGVCDSSSMTGLSVQELAELSPDERARRIEKTAELFRAAGAHAVIETIADLPELLDRLQGKTLAAASA